MIHVVALDQIIEIDLGDVPIKTSYQLPENIQQIIDVQTNNDLLVVQTESYYYVYKRYRTQVDNILSTHVNTHSRFLISPRSPNLIFIDRFEAHAYIASEGYMIINNPEAGLNQTIQVTAISSSYDGSADVICNFTFEVNAISDLTIVYNTNEFPAASSYSDSPVHEVFYLSDYFLGSNLVYKVESTSDA